MRRPYSVIGGKLQNENVEVNIADHCNLACRGCSHLSPMMSRRFLDPDEVFRDLSALAGSYQARRVKLLGGEPLLHPGILDMLRGAKLSGVAERVAVTTNGVLLPRMKDEFWEAVDEVNVSSYPDHRLPPNVLERCLDRATTHGAVVYLKEYPHFRETYAARGTHDSRLVRRVFETCEIAHRWRCHTVAGGYLFKCSLSLFIHAALDGGNRAPPPDAIEIESDPGFLARLVSFLESSEPLEACNRCLGTVGLRFAHEQIRGPAWTEPQDRPSEELVDFRLLRKVEWFDKARTVARRLGIRRKPQPQRPLQPTRVGVPH